MKIETELALNSMRKNKKRTLFTTISLILCTTLILTTIILISSIRNGVSENFDVEHNDYHFILNDLSPERFNAIKNKSYIDKIYIQKSEDAPLEKVENSFTPQDNVTVYLKYNKIQNVCEYSKDIIGSLGLSEMEAKYISRICNFNQRLLTVHGFIDVKLGFNDNGTIPDCRMRVNYSDVIALVIIITIITFSVFFIIILYNAFLITINERNKEYAILNSVGGTEGQVLKMFYTEAIIMGIAGITFGGILSTLISSIVLDCVNNILNSAGYYFKLVLDIKYIALSIIIIVINIFLAVLIPSIKASTSSVIQGIRNNKQIKYKRRNTILEKILPIEGRVAIKNIKRNKSKYRLITILLVVSMASFIAMSTYLKYEKETADIVTEYDVDAGISCIPKYLDELTGITVNRDYKPILKQYEEKYGKKLEVIEYRQLHNEAFLVEPTENIASDSFGFPYIDNKKSIQMGLIALDNKTYNKYIKEINASYGDFIIYNVTRLEDLKENDEKYTYLPVFKEDSNLKLSLIAPKYIGNEEWDYEVIDTEILAGNYILTDKIVEGYKEIKTYGYPTLFMSMETYNELDNYIEKTYDKCGSAFEKDTRQFWDNRADLYVKIKCDNVIELKNFIDRVSEKQNLGFYVSYYSLENQEKIMYIKIVELMLKVMLVAIVGIGIVSMINLMNASLCERKEDFNILYRMGATKENIKKILIYESVYMFIKAIFIQEYIEDMDINLEQKEIIKQKVLDVLQKT